MASKPSAQDRAAGALGCPLEAGDPVWVHWFLGMFDGQPRRTWRKGWLLKPNHGDYAIVAFTRTGGRRSTVGRNILLPRLRGKPLKRRRKA